MAAIVVRNLSEETHRALRVRAARNGRSAEAELRIIIEDAVRPGERLRIGSELAAFGRLLGGLDIDVQRDPSAPEPARFE